MQFRSLGKVSVPTHNPDGIYRGSAITLGNNYNRSTSASFSRLTGQLRLYTPLVINSITWDIRNTGTYKLAFVDSTVSSPADIYVVQAAQVVGAAGVITFMAAPEFLLLPGLYYLSLSKSGGVTWWDGPVYSDADMYTYGCWYDGTSYGSYTIPAKLIGNRMAYSSIYNFQPSPI